MSDLTRESLSELAALIRVRKVSPVEVLNAHLHRIEKLNPKANAIVTLSPDAMREAQNAEDAIMRGDNVGLLHGVPLTIKDTIETAGIRTTSGSRVRAKYIPREDASSVARLRKAGAIILGKTNVSEMAAAYDTENPVFGRANNPYQHNFTTGGSSGGEAAAIAACMSPGGLGSDLVGSIRIPAHFCGIVGLKPATGRVPCDKHIPSTAGATSHGAVMGPMARYVRDVELLFQVLADSLPLDIAQGKSEISGCHAAWHTFDGTSPVTKEIRDAVESVERVLQTVGVEVREERPPGVEHGHDLWTLLFARASAANMRNEYAGHEAEAGPLVRYLLDSSSVAPTAALDEFPKAWSRRNELRETLLTWMKTTPFIIAPVGAITAFEHGTRKVNIDGQSISIFRAFSYAQTYNVFDLPVVCVPVGFSREGLPIGVQIIGRPFEEYSVLAVASIIENALGGWREPSLALSS